MDSKTCIICNLEKPIDQMATGAKSNKTGEHYRRNICKQCANKRREEARRANRSEAREASDKRRQDKFKGENKDKLKDKSLRAAYGITLEDYNQLLDSQGGGCAICTDSTSRGNRMLAVDHCHTTHKIRGLLCSDCNTALGLLKDNKINILSALNYLIKSEETINN